MSAAAKMKGTVYDMSKSPVLSAQFLLEMIGGSRKVRRLLPREQDEGFKLSTRRCHRHTTMEPDALSFRHAVVSWRCGFRLCVASKLMTRSTSWVQASHKINNLDLYIVKV